MLTIENLKIEFKSHGRRVAPVDGVFPLGPG
jgi:peptide/nickel transport system ATP-binding protein